MEILIDFDGTCVTHEYPKIGRDIGAQRVLKKLVEEGHNLILFTMRSGKPLEEAVEWFKNSKIPLYGINTNPTQKEWTDSPKAYGQLIIDDIGLGVPLCLDINTNRRFVDWSRVEGMLLNNGIIR